MEKSKLIYLEHREGVEYPKTDFLFHPSVCYPEYFWGCEALSSEKNEVYDMVRNCLAGLGMDEDNYGHPEWNPLKEIISSSDVVLIKPNMVKDYELTEDYECSLTHPSIVRAILDYCVIASPKKIILGDAPIQGANMDKILEDCGYIKLLDFYKERGVNIEFFDFRETIVRKRNGIIKEIKSENGLNGLKIDIGKESKHYSKVKKEYRINCYTDEKINQYHSGEKHEYVISKIALEADVIINLPKPKTHRFAGITGAQKNFVGVCSDKESLPHFAKGMKSTGGDETNKKSIIQRLLSQSNMQSLKEGKREHYIRAMIFHWFYAALMRIKGKEIFVNGAWYGNDTIWRTIIDINRIILSATKNGEIYLHRKCRKVFTIGDMIIVGENDGPLNSTPKRWGCIMVSKNCAIFDYILCKMAGFDENRIPTIINSIQAKMLCPYAVEDTELYSNLTCYNGISLKELSFKADYYLAPHPFWKSYLTS